MNKSSVSGSPKKPIRLTPEVLRKMNQFDPANGLTEHIVYPQMPIEVVNHSKSTHRIPAFYPLPASPSPPPPVEQVKTISDLKPAYVAYDGTPIVLVPLEYVKIVVATFGPGIYGVDTESDCNTRDLRLIQIFNGTTVYIFRADSLSLAVETGILKFMSSKDRVKVGVDLDGDCLAIRKHVRKINPYSKSNGTHKILTISGCLDLQSIAKTMGEIGISLDKLADKYVVDYVEYKQQLGSYANPTPEQYIYAANDAILSLKIYFPLIQKRVSQNWSFNRVTYISNPLPMSALNIKSVDTTDTFVKEVVDDCLHFGIKL